MVRWFWCLIIYQLMHMYYDLQVEWNHDKSHIGMPVVMILIHYYVPFWANKNEKCAFESCILLLAVKIRNSRWQVISPIYDGTSKEVNVASGGEASLLRENFLIFMTSNMSWPFYLDLLVRMLVLLSTKQLPMTQVEQNVTSVFNDVIYQKNDISVWYNQPH
jgi:hypothetical protein